MDYEAEDRNILDKLRSRVARHFDDSAECTGSGQWFDCPVGRFVACQDCGADVPTVSTRGGNISLQTIYDVDSPKWHTLENGAEVRVKQFEEEEY